jgi:hypothetical protein
MFRKEHRHATFVDISSHPGLIPFYLSFSEVQRLKTYMQLSFRLSINPRLNYGQ